MDCCDGRWPMAASSSFPHRKALAAVCLVRDGIDLRRAIMPIFPCGIRGVQGDLIGGRRAGGGGRVGGS